MSLTRTCRPEQLVTLFGMDGQWHGRDAEREVRLVDDTEAVLPEQTRDDTDRGWGESTDSNDERLYAERPPHW